MRAKAVFAVGLVAVACGSAVEDPERTRDALVVQTSTPLAFRYVFVTSTTYTGDLGGVSGADAKCRARARKAHLRGKYKAWISDALGHEPATTFTQSTVPYKLVDGTTVVANDWTDLVDGAIAHAIDQDELGNASTTAVNPFTSTLPDGTYNLGFVGDTGEYACNNWVSPDPNANNLGTTFGDTSATDRYWTAARNGGGCNDLHPLYCFQQ